MNGWIKLHRKLLDNPIVCKDSDHLAVWTYLLLNATHKEHLAVFGKEKIVLQPGQLITGRVVISEKLRVSESKVQRILSAFENEQQIEQQTGNKNRLISILSWSDYQDSEQQDEQLVNNKRTTTEQQLNTNKKLRTKEVKNVKKKLYGDHVQLTEDEYARLVEEWGEDEVKRFIDDANYYFEQQPARKKKYSNHNLMLRRWKKMDLEKGIKRRVQKSASKDNVMTMEEWKAHEQRRKEEMAQRAAEI